MQKFMPLLTDPKDEKKAIDMEAIRKLQQQAIDRVKRV